MRSKLFATLILSTALFAAPPEKVKEKDMCAPPPGGVAPSLPARIMTGQGTVEMTITTSNPEAQKFFNQGLAQMHSFWATEAERSFLQAAALDPAAPMPQWGIAMVAAGDFRPRFQLTRDRVAPNIKKMDANPRTPEGGPGRALAAARKATELSAVPGKATDLEKLYVASIAARRNPDSKDPDGDYIAGLRAVIAANPKEVEAKTYLALHLMQGFTTPDKQPKGTSMEAVSLLRDLLATAPEHPGVHHFVIHGWEGSSFAKDAWPSCRRYSELVTNIPHALHMPGHIWAQTGKWDEAEKSFSDAAVNERGYLAADKLYSNGHHGHNVHFLITTLCFKGDFDKAMAASQELLAIKENPREVAAIDNAYSAHRQGWFGLMETLVHFEKWDQILDGKTLVVYDKPREQAWRHWAMGLAYVAKRSASKAKAEAKAMDLALKELKEKTQDVPPTLTVARQELDGHIEFVRGKTDQAFRTLQAAIKAERALLYTEPPSYPRPVAEALGPMALKKGKLDVAEDAFKQALEQYPESPRSLAGLEKVKRGTHAD